MRKLMTKEITQTSFEVARTEIIDGKPVAVIQPKETILGELTRDKAQKLMNKKYSESVIVYDLKVFTQTYEMEVEEFIKVATLKEVKE
jgi:hypothetical protein